MVEMSSSSWNIIRQISERVVENGGAALVADYGHTGQDGDTFRAFRHHKQVDPLELPGTADITADVDFSLLKTQISPDCSWHGPVSQVNIIRHTYHLKTLILHLPILNIVLH